MNTEASSSNGVGEKLLKIVGALLAENDHGHPPGPTPGERWDHVIRSALVSATGRGDEVSLNPQPLPPRIRFFLSIADAIISRAELLQDVAAELRPNHDQQGIIIVGGLVSRFSDEWCGNGFRLRHPLPGPHPHWFSRELETLDLLVLGFAFRRAAREAFTPELRQAFTSASERFVGAGLSRT